MSNEEAISIIISEAVHVHKSLGPGLLENIYKKCLAHRLVQHGLTVEIEKPIPVYFEGIRMDCGYRADLVVGDSIIVEIKCIEGIDPLHIAQLLTYLRCMKLRFGLVLNFKSLLMRTGIKRVLNGYA